MSFKEPLIGGDDELAIDKIQSHAFVTGVSGWRIERLGDAEFNSVDVRGTIKVGPDNGRQVVITTETLVGLIQFYTHVATEFRPGLIEGSAGNVGAANEFTSITMLGPYHSVADDHIYLIMSSQNADGTSQANIQIGWFDAAGGVGGDLIMALDKNTVSVETDFSVNPAKVGGEWVVFKSANESVVSSTTIQSDAELTFTATPGIWMVEFHLAVEGSPGDIQTDWLVPAGTTGLKYCHGATQTAGSFTSRDDTRSRHSAHGYATDVFYQCDAAGTASAIRETSVMTVTTTGSVTFRWCQGSSSVTATTILSRSYLWARRLL